MSEIKRGDRVRVTVDTEAVATYVSPRGDLLDVRTSDGIECAVAQEWCTVIAPPIKVGDVVTADNIGQLPDGSIVSARGWAPYIKFGGEWFEINRTKLFETSEREVLACGAPTVAVIGSGS